MTTEKSPYRFVPRPLKPRQKPIPHSELAKDRFDIAFEIEWTALTPLALNPCIDPGAEANNPDTGKSSQYSGFDRRWLTAGGRLCISPFTVKSAIANGIANLLGSCYRVIDRVEGDQNYSEGTYPYTGAFKRYRVQMTSQSKPGIITDIKLNPDGSRPICIQPVQEFYMKRDLPDRHKDLKYGDSVYAAVVPQRDKKNPNKILKKPRLVLYISNKMEDVKSYILESKTNSKDSKICQLGYFGEYRFGMNHDDPNDCLVSPSLGKPYKHRFYLSDGNPVHGTLMAENFLPLPELKTKVYTGRLRHETRSQASDPRPVGMEWYQDLSRLQVNDWVYFQMFNGQVAHIGKNYQFKALFYHPDTVPPGQEACCRSDQLCPRCSLFGMVDTSDRPGRVAVGYGGRFKSSALVSQLQLSPVRLPCKVPYLSAPGKLKEVEILELRSSGQMAARQVFLPLLLGAKPNKPDVDGYFDPVTGYLKGPKEFFHGACVNFLGNIFEVRCLADLFKLIAFIDSKLATKTEGGSLKFSDYTHELRNWAVVGESGLSFAGTLGVENCSPEEAAALVMLLDGRVAGHGFKIGLGKSMALGSVVSCIRAIWVRRGGDYSNWQRVEVKATPDRESIYRTLDNCLPEADAELGRLINTQAVLNRINSFEMIDEFCLKFPPKGRDFQKRDYWTNFAQTL